MRLRKAFAMLIRTSSILKRLRDVIVSADFHRFDRALGCTESRDHHEQELRLSLLHVLEKLEARHMRHLQVRDDEIERFLL